MSTAYDVIYNQVGGAIEVMDSTSDVVQIDWSRNLDDFDEATITLSETVPGCCARIKYIRPYLHELQLMREGWEVFDGPVLIGPSGVKPSIRAGGMTDWFDVRFVRDAYDWSGVPIPASDAVDFLVRSAMTLADPGLVPWLEIIETLTPVDRKTSITPVIHEGLWDAHLSSLVGTVVHMSTHGRRVTFWPYGQGLRHMGTLTDADFVDTAPVFRDGRQFQTAAAVWNGVAEDGGPDPIAGGYAGGVHPQWGVLVERSIIDPKTTNVSGSAAAGNLVTPDVPLQSSEVEGSRMELSCNSELDFHLIQPGNTVDVVISQGCMPFDARMQIVRVGDTYRDGESHPYVVLKEMEN